MSRPSAACSIRSAAPMPEHLNERRAIDVGKAATEHQRAVESIGRNPAPLRDHAQDLLHERREMKAIDLGGLAPLLEA